MIKASDFITRVQGVKAKAGYIIKDSQSSSVLYFFNLSDSSVLPLSDVYIPDTGVAEPQYHGSSGDSTTSMDFYKCAAVSGVDLVVSPINLKANIYNGYIVTCSSFYDNLSEYAAWQAFDSSVQAGYNKGWFSDPSDNSPWIQIQFPQPVHINKYRFDSGWDHTFLGTLTQWELMGSLDGTNWIILDTHTTGSTTQGQLWQSQLIQTSSSFKFYRLSIVKGSNSYIGISNLYLLNSSPDKQWVGYKAILQNGIYLFQSDSTNLTYTTVTPEIGKVYTADVLAQATLYQG